MTPSQRDKIRETYEAIRASKGGKSKPISPADVIGNMKGKGLTDANVREYINTLDEVYGVVGKTGFSKIKDKLKSVAPIAGGSAVGASMMGYDE